MRVKGRVEQDEPAERRERVRLAHSLALNECFPDGPLGARRRALSRGV